MSNHFHLAVETPAGNQGLNGAQTGDLFMSLIHTCRLNRVNPFA